MCMEKEKTKMNPPVLDWNWKLWTPSFIDIDIEMNKYMDVSMCQEDPAMTSQWPWTP